MSREGFDLSLHPLDAVLLLQSTARCPKPPPWQRAAFLDRGSCAISPLPQSALAWAWPGLGELIRQHLLQSSGNTTMKVNIIYYIILLYYI